MRKLIITITILTSIQLFSQDCDCLKNLKWLTETFEKNDAGFQYILDKKGENRYLMHNEFYTKKASQISNLNECHKLLNDWTEFFRKDHLQVQIVRNEQTNLSDKETIEKYGNSERYEITPKAFKSYVDKLGLNTGYEGLWNSSAYTIGVVKDKTNPNREYVGFIVQSKNPNWRKNQVKFEIFKTEKAKYNMKYYMGDHSVRQFENINLLGNNYLSIGSGFINLKRVLPKIKTEKNVEDYFRRISSQKPFIESVSKNTLLLRIPSFERSNKELIDSLLDSNDKLIKNTQNLIIDLRGNGGGSDISYKKITPYIYTNPIREVGVEYLSTELNNSRMIKFMNDPIMSKDEKKWAKEGLEKLNKHLGEYISLNESVVDIKTLENIYPNPVNVAVLINGSCGSTTEQFLLEAKQSKKVKLYGTTTLGNLDISNMYSVISPSKQFRLWYGLTKSYRIPGMTIDGKGIQPDYYFDKTIKPYEWVDKTVEILNNK